MRVLILVGLGLGTVWGLASHLLPHLGAVTQSAAASVDPEPSSAAPAGGSLLDSR